MCFCWRSKRKDTHCLMTRNVHQSYRLRLVFNALVLVFLGKQPKAIRTVCRSSGASLFSVVVDGVIRDVFRLRRRCLRWLSFDNDDNSILREAAAQNSPEPEILVFNPVGLWRAEQRSETATFRQRSTKRFDRSVGHRISLSRLSQNRLNRSLIIDHFTWLRTTFHWYTFASTTGMEPALVKMYIMYSIEAQKLCGRQRWPLPMRM